VLSRSRSQIVSIGAAGRNTGLHHAYREECKRQSVEPGPHFSAVLSWEKARSLPFASHQFSWS
jgi:hypothetical protein